jgi:hypothetical protein
MTILNLPTFIEQTEKTPEQKLLESLQQMQIERPQAEVPRFTRYGNRMAERGGFDVLPQEQLSGMTQQQIDQYEAERKKARGAGISETLMRVGQAFAGKDASGLALQREQARQQAEMQSELNAAIDQMNIPESQRILFKLLPPDQQLEALYPSAKQVSSVSERSRDRLMELNNNPNRNPEQEYEMNLLKTEVYGKKQVIPFFDSNGNPLPQIITNWDLNDNPELLNNLVQKGFATVGTNPSVAFNAPITANDEIPQKWQDTKNTLDLINKLSVVLDEGRDSPTVAGAIADLVNTGIYQVKAANKLLSFQENYPKEYSEKVNYIQNKHGSVLNKISADRGIATSTVMRLAYALAKQQDPGGRLSDKDIDAAIEVIGGSGANVEKRLSVLGSLYNSLTGEYETYLETQGRKYPGNKSIQGTINRFTDLPTFSYSSAPISVGKYKIEPVD